jgi:hypothetical protein
MPTFFRRTVTLVSSVARVTLHLRRTSAAGSEGDDSDDALENALKAANSPRFPDISGASKYAPIFISVIALATSIYSAMLTRSYDRLSARPFVQFYRETDIAAEEVGLNMLNDGLGPAVISDMRIHLDGKKVDDFDTVSSDNLDLFLDTTPSWEHEGPYDFIIRSGSKAKIYYTKTSNVSNTEGFRNLIRNRLFAIVYVCSKYDECGYKCSTVADDECRNVETRLAPASGQIEPSHNN